MDFVHKKRALGSQSHTPTRDGRVTGGQPPPLGSWLHPNADDKKGSLFHRREDVIGRRQRYLQKKHGIMWDEAKLCAEIYTMNKEMCAFPK